MFEETPLSSPHTMHTPNLWKGGDFMAVEDEIDRMISEGGPVVKNCTFPERKGIIRTAEEIATTFSDGQPNFDRVVFLSVSRMDAGE